MPWGAIGTADMPHAYNKKEWNNTYDLQEYDSKARQYYPALMRTTTQDPLAEHKIKLFLEVPMSIIRF